MTDIVDMLEAKRAQPASAAGSGASRRSTGAAS